MRILSLVALRIGGALLWVGLAMAQESPWHLGATDKRVQAPAAINTVNERPGPHRIVVAVIDSGVIASHPSLVGQLLPGYDMVSAAQNLRKERSADFSPDERGAKCGSRLMAESFRTHGTEVASLVAGNGIEGVFGVNPAAKVVPIRVFGACPMSRKDLLDAISWAAGIPVPGVPENANPAKIINLSMGGGSSVCNPELQVLIDHLVQKKIIFVAAAGNNFHKPLPEPANCSGVISVGSINAENQIEVYSALDPRTLVYAPGGGAALPADAPWGVNKLKVATYELDFFGKERSSARFSGVGTSFAAPVVAGFISLWLSHNPDKTLDDFLSNKARFVRPALPIEKCARCIPLGLFNADRMGTP